MVIKFLSLRFVGDGLTYLFRFTIYHTQNYQNKDYAVKIMSVGRFLAHIQEEHGLSTNRWAGKGYRVRKVQVG